MIGFIEGEDRSQATLFSERLDDYIAEDSSVRVIDVFIDDLDLSGLGFKTIPEATGVLSPLPTATAGGFSGHVGRFGWWLQYSLTFTGM